MIQTDSFVHRIIAFCTGIGADAADDPALRLRKQLLLGIQFLIILAGIVWGSIYLLFDEPVAALIPYAYAVLSACSILLFRWRRDFAGFRFRQLVLILLLPFLLMLTLGGFGSSSAVVLWSLLCPFGALIFDEPRRSLGWMAAFFVLVIVGGLLEPFGRTGNNLPAWMITLFFVLNIGAISAIVLTALYTFISQRDTLMKRLADEQAKSENLLLNVLPREIAAILKDNPRTIADHFDEASVLFADMVEFTRLTAEMPPVEMVELLNEIFSQFDLLVERYGVEKIRTIGDSYMVVAGVPTPRPDHAQALANMALDMQAYLANRPPHGDHRLRFRIGINSGPLIAGVIGRKKFIYDLWGDVVNTAARMESHAQAGMIQITDATYVLLRDEFICQPRGLVDVKSKGAMPTYYLIGRRGEARTPDESLDPLPADGNGASSSQTR